MACLRCIHFIAAFLNLDSSGWILDHWILILALLFAKESAEDNTDRIQYYSTSAGVLQYSYEYSY